MKYLKKKKKKRAEMTNVCFGNAEKWRSIFWILEKAFDWVLGEELWCCTGKPGVAEKLFGAVQDPYESRKAAVECAKCVTEVFKVDICSEDQLQQSQGRRAKGKINGCS